ncbi:MAG TPA: cytochrome oxidase small assembly protein [Casimicrobiaceae bacterium]|nr:cytochrome oxidase small assembly protein [Casimicrobiaceae bacterium]
MTRTELAARNKRTAVILASIALVFFVGIIAAQALATPTVTIAVLGGAILLFLALAIGRHLRNARD